MRSNLTLRRCRICNCSSYCPKACQKADWPVHKQLCSVFQEPSTAPGPTFRHTILFPDNGKRPRFVWVNCPLQFAQNGEGSWDRADQQQFLRNTYTRTVRIHGNIQQSWALKNNLEVIYGFEPMTNGYFTNTSIMEVTKARMLYPWCGHLLAMKLLGFSINPGRYINLDMVDYRDVVDLFLKYPTVRMSDMSLAKPTTSP